MNIQVAFTSLYSCDKVCNTFKQDRQCKYKRNVEARSRNHCCCRKTNNIIYSECVSVALSNSAHKAHALYYIVICDLACYTVIVHVIL
jgi:hypothetical protein